MNFSVFSLTSRRSLRQGLCAFAAIVALSVTIPAFAASEPSPLNGQKKSYQYSWAEEIQLGAEADKEISQQMGLYDNAEVQAYVQAIGQRVLGTSTFRDPATPAMYRNTNFTFRVLDSPVVNAFVHAVMHFVLSSDAASVRRPGSRWRPCAGMLMPIIASPCFAK